MDQRGFLTAVSALALCFGTANLKAQEHAGPEHGDTTANRSDGSTREPDAHQANNGMSDRELIRRIRRSLVEDRSLSTYARSVKVIAQNGKVILRGPVLSEEEKTIVEQKAEVVAGAGNVINETVVKIPHSKDES